MNKKFVKNKKGFTLIEMLVAVFIFSVSLAALMSISARAIFAARNAEQNVVANYLAIEALESVRHIRDTAFLNNPMGESFENAFTGHFAFPGCDSDGVYCDFYYDNYPVLQDCSTCIVWQTNDGKYLNVESGESTALLTDTGYSRRISFDQLTVDEVLVTVQVGWDGGMVEAHQSLYLWF